MDNYWTGVLITMFATSNCSVFKNRAAFPALLITLTLLLAALPAAAALEDIAQKADELYEQKDFEAAIELYTRILDSGYVGGNLYYNLGNCYYKNGEIGRAILAYERALKEMPHNRDVKYNLKLASERTVDRIEQPPRLPVWDWLDYIRDLFAPGPLAWTTWLLAVIAASLFSVTFFLKKDNLRLFILRVSLVVAIVFILSGSVLSLRMIEDLKPEKAVILVEKVVVRSAPDPSSGEVFHLHEGTRVVVVKELDVYYEIRLEDGRQGWLPANTLEKV